MSDFHVQPGFITAGQAEMLGRSAETTERTRADMERQFVPQRGDIPAKLTAYDSGTGYYSWTRRAFDTDGTRYDHPSGETGDPTSQPARAMNGETIDVSSAVDVWLRPTHGTSIGVVYEIIPPSIGGASGNTPTSYTGSASIAGVSVSATPSAGDVKSVVSMSFSAAGTYLIFGEVTAAVIRSTTSGEYAALQGAFTGWDPLTVSAGALPSGWTLYTFAIHNVVEPDLYGALSGRGNAFPSALLTLDVGASSGSLTYGVVPYIMDSSGTTISGTLNSFATAAGKFTSLKIA